MGLQIRCSSVAYPDCYVRLEITIKKVFILLITLSCILAALNSAHSEGTEQVTITYSHRFLKFSDPTLRGLCLVIF